MESVGGHLEAGGHLEVQEVYRGAGGYLEVQEGI